MKRSRFTQEQVIGVLKENQAGVSVRLVPQARDQRREVLRDVLNVAVEVWRHGSVGRAQVGGAGG